MPPKHDSRKSSKSPFAISYDIRSPRSSERGVRCGGRYAPPGGVNGDRLSEGTKEGFKRARAEGKLLGRPKGTTSFKLDGKEREIKGYLSKGGNLANVARIFGVSW
jgi:hypothetical protein